MNKPNIHILYEFKDGPWGGANQFLINLKKHFENILVNTSNLESAAVILFNSYPFRNEYYFKEILILKKKRHTIIAHRVDGPIFLYREKDIEIDKIIFNFNQSVADATIFQSNWSREECYKLGMKKNNFETVIINAPDSDIFYPPSIKELTGKIKLIATSWSENMRKGFDIYKFLDENLDFEKYDMTFVGNSPIKFKNIDQLPAVESSQLAVLLREHDIFITGSINDPCSNSLIEALHCGLPAIGRNSGGHPELIGEAGLLFDDENDVILKIDFLANNYFEFRERISMPTINEIANQYYEFFKMINDKTQSGDYKVKTYSYFNYLKIMTKSKLWKMKQLIG